ncbi:MAG: LPS assembly lipoprotein LptE [Candidatus Zixiibacteriota bacterium]
MMTFYRHIAFIGLLGLVLGGCAIYSFSPGGKSSIKSIAVRQFENRTIEAGLSSRMTDLVVDAFIADGNLKVASENDADAIMAGELSSYENKAYTFDESDNVSQYVVKVVFNIALQNASDGGEIWKEAFYSEGVYLADSETEEDGQIRAAQKLVIDVINRTTKNW